jgi:hypothetical protein
VLEANPNIERWRIVVVALATIAALPLFLFENPNSTASLTGVAGADTRVVVTSSSPLTETDSVLTKSQDSNDKIYMLLNRSDDWHAARVSEMSESRLRGVAVKYEEEAMGIARSISEKEFTEQEKQLKILFEEEERKRLFAEEDQRRENVLNNPGPTTTIVATEPDPNGPEKYQWEALKYCESTGNYQAVSPTGNYRGAYQFSVETWDWIADLYHGNLVGVDPAAARPQDQDRMAESLYLLRGRGQWPVCGRYLP